MSLDELRRVQERLGKIIHQRLPVRIAGAAFAMKND
jgi:hypothetical protein